MNRRRESLLLLALTALSLLTNNGVAALTQKYCSNENTASDSADQSIFQSNGRCTTNCTSYAFAVVQGQSCWCSNYIPSNQESTGSCNEACPGYPYEYCGSTSSNLYGYVAVGSNAASGTAGSASTSSETVSTSTQEPGSQSATTSTSFSTSIDTSTGQTTGSSTSTQATSAAPSSSSSSAETSIVVSSQTATVVSSQTVVNSVIVETTVTADASSSDSATPSTFSTSTSTSTTKGTTPVVTTIISSGNIVTITTAPTAAPIQTSKSSGGISKGAVAGIVVAAFAALAIVAFGLLFCLRRRRQDEHIVDSTGMITTPSRMNSQMSRNGLLGNAFRPNSLVHTQNGSSDGGVSPIAPIAERRSSKPLVFDQRLNPDFYLHEDSSRVSINTLDDHRDYNRKLNIANPDPVDRDQT